MPRLSTGVLLGQGGPEASVPVTLLRSYAAVGRGVAVRLRQGPAAAHRRQGES
jgi:hypothetical protein